MQLKILQNNKANSYNNLIIISNDSVFTESFEIKNGCVAQLVRASDF